MVAKEHKEYLRKDYKAPTHLIDTIHLNFLLNDGVTRVESRMRVLPNHPASERPTLFLHGRDDLKLVAVKINGEAAPVEAYELDSAKGLTLKSPPADPFDLEIHTDVRPEQNSLLEGLYKSGGNYCTQCEAEGFRGITFFMDRPDVMAKYTTRVEADKARYPVLLSNGNLIESGELEGGRHFTVWEDPFRKPCYLFALVAGDLAMKEDTFTTISGKSVALRIFTRAHDIGRVDFAMQSLIRSMKWDEEVFGLEYDLELFNIVAVDDFNMGAMENKSLNVFNSRLVLATPDTATDGDFGRIEGVVGHEYFHNYTGNRVTCRDWFQLTLKEGLTVYRDQEFSADMNSRPVKRVEDVCRLRAAQFSEDSGPMAHPIRPESYIKMDNFYTLTVYEKGAEVVRLYEQVLGKEGFRKGMDLYFQRHDGQAVTCDDFLAAMADANDEDLSALAKWYNQAGTPRLTAIPTYNPSEKTYTLRFKQETLPSPGQPTKDPVWIPVRMGLLGPDGAELPQKLRGGKPLGTETVLRVTEAEQEFVFEGVKVAPVPSLLRGFSAPVHLTVEGQSDEDLLHILAHDTDSFNRWEAGHVLAKKLLRALYTAAKDSSEGTVPERLSAAGGVNDSLVNAYRSLLNDVSVDGAFKAFAISLPEISELLDKLPEADPLLLHEVREFVTRELAQRLRPELEAAVKANDSAPGEPYEFTAAACAKRALKNKALAYLAALGEPTVTKSLLRRFRDATNMTDEISALAVLDRAGGQLHATPGCVEARVTALGEFSSKWEKEPLVLLKWLALQAGSNVAGNVDAVKALTTHPSVALTNPNTCYSLFLGFARSPVNFHAVDGSGYRFLADSVLQVDKINHQVASRIATAFTTFKKYDPARQALMRAQLQRIKDTEGLSDNVFEIRAAMATEEYLARFIAGGKRYQELPDRFRATVPEDEWRRRVKDFCIARGYSWSASVAQTACGEQEYYDELTRHYRLQKRLFPYHLGEYVCRHMRLSPYRYYTSVLVDSMKEDAPYDSIPNFTAADIVRIMGIGRNEYISVMVQAKSKKLMWRMNRGIVKDLLPQAPLNIQIDPWWVVHVVNLGEAEYRQLDPTEATVCHIAARPGGARYSDLNGMAVRQLYQRGLVWLDVPVRPEDHLSIPPLEGFVSNKTQISAVDPLETLLYQIFVAASDRVTVAKLADILNVDVPTLRVAISMACRLRFCRKLDMEGGGGDGLASPTAAAGALAAGLDALDLDAMLRSPEMGGDGAASPTPEAHDDSGAGGSGIAFVVDAEVTGYLMMGALTPNCKKHSVTLFEGGRVYGADVINELIEELHTSVAMSEGFEGEMKNLVAYARSLALVLECVRASSGGRPIELLRKESLAAMPPSQAFRILSHSYSAVLPITSLAFPPLPLSNTRAVSPVNYGPTPAAQTPWLHLALYSAVGAGPRSLVLAAGQQLRRLPGELLLAAGGATHALLWPFDAGAVRAQALPVLVERPFLLFTLNEYLARTALLVQPVRLTGGAAASQLSDTPALPTIDVPLPLRPAGGEVAGAAQAAPAGGGGWNAFEQPEAAPAAGDGGAGGSSAAAQQGERAVGYLPGGETQEVALPAGLTPALHRLGLGSSPGFLRLVQASAAEVTAQGAASGGDGSAAGGEGGASEERWLPLALWLGMPMQPSALCQAVCDASLAARFLEPKARQRQREGQATLSAALAALAASHGACSTAFAGGGRDDDLGSFVDRPTRNLRFAGGQLAQAEDLAEVLDGAPLLAALGAAAALP
ncbi:puromycin-sensitive aminopeptidase isoform X1 [Micractinium conductrix]|uniref:Puromycin-sensitive aminopeptidase isoform X1 n=1 Tax=Micractinium conductrix TaxID=554055 RepID=A0A2P6V4K9_9CHLO|nr:puromycin-sensitive aminopeptidase isoform X1 [Micractinium conductrix]|eukprot:PSC69009.1 puromycin-sensitive aminopeptidase isoform X1 [Micractinium conductrix]